ncbi:alpha/beta fold hydrolase [Saccharibacillus endophyticus]|uniref:Acetyltransferase n=1 Tax=Saccharibacillus endophyticus TaxID=2060666 RepID=A0ABQ1ZVJ4_9BACL|nr:alpha/beta hydrolase [Saccharibacillus endophyticus]GGH79745.1 acetyltransferase [Saccharibacillus endophyticus]
MSEKMIQSKNAEIFTETFGDPSHPALLLIMGAQSSMIWWEEKFCLQLADQGLFIIRYDNRDVGRSTTYEPGQPGYGLEEMAGDAIGVLDAYGIERSHIMGMSLGGMLAQMIALRDPERVQSLILLAASNFAEHLPPMEEKVATFFADMGAVDLTDRESFIRFTIDRSRVLVGSKHAFDEEKADTLAKLDFDRANRPSSMTNHALLAGGESDMARTSEIAVPVLVIHGEEDPIIPYAHGEHLANVLPHAELLKLAGSGHELHEEDWATVIEAIAAHVK